MSCCIPCQDTNRFFSRFARLYRWKHRLFGLEKTQKDLIALLCAEGVAEKSLLEVGCGAGYLHRDLLHKGATRVIGVDISEGLLTEARSLSDAGGLGDRVTYYFGDFVEVAESLSGSDIAVLDKVVCCYPDPERLLDAVTSCTVEIIALTYPRNRWLTRVGIGVLAWINRMSGSDFRPYVHNPVDINHWITQHGFERRNCLQTTVWMTELYGKCQ
ncbi:MAG TPA: methyltransferase domain-containing protein [Chromatiales bacterium]|jgi:magnesium-protoporphyrin O-methyltransferase|nr:methyltransferase domain-containing protein [Chromatiaceae bacterium]HIB84705.1 methyltransferase domain-containing protein [Chromatiaceae bacterium]HIN81781.1 methyltransferase domain-containing protein [Chromatiales bacterium]HIO14319.1 methyltransferase domain-containing protein [Chromatiales bacterium]HIO54955.1 methyltransferase domain-containing protein [Chromatiales bacterium]